MWIRANLHKNCGGKGNCIVCVFGIWGKTTIPGIFCVCWSYSVTYIYDIPEFVLNASFVTHAFEKYDTGSHWLRLKWNKKIYSNEIEWINEKPQKCTYMSPFFSWEDLWSLTPQLDTVIISFVPRPAGHVDLSTCIQVTIFIPLGVWLASKHTHMKKINIWFPLFSLVPRCSQAWAPSGLTAPGYEARLLGTRLGSWVRG